MIREHGTNLDRAELKLHVTQLFKGHVTCHLIETHGKEGALHLLKERAAQSMHRAFVTHDPDINLWVVGRNEKGKTLDVVPMRMGDQHRDFERLVFEFLHQGLAKRANAGTRVEDENLIADAHLNARGIATEHCGLDSGCRNRTPHAPETHDRGTGNGWCD